MSAALALVGCASDDGPGPASKNSPVSELTIAENIDNLRARLTSFADRYLARIGEVSQVVLSHTDSQEIRQNLQETRFLSSFAVVQLAGGANPAAALLDIMVMTRLQARVLDRERFRELFPPEDYRALTDATDELANDVWTIGRDYLTQMQLDELNHIIDQWLEENPDRQRVASVRFENFTSLRGGAALEKDLNDSMLFGTISDAADSVDNAIRFAARTKFVAERMPLLLGWQVQQVAGDLLTSPVVAEVLQGFADASQSLQRASKSIDRLPQTLAEQSDKVQSLLDQADTTVGSVREAIQDVDDLTDPATRTAEQFQRTAESITALIQSADQLTLRYTGADGLGGAESSADGEPFDITRYTAAAEQLAVAARAVDEVLTSSGQLLDSEAVSETLREFNRSAERQIENSRDAGRSLLRTAFWYGLLLIAAACVAGLLTAIIYRFTAHRLLPERPS